MTYYPLFTAKTSFNCFYNASLSFLNWWYTTFDPGYALDKKMKAGALAVGT
jgi:hypothetical protein